MDPTGSDREREFVRRKKLASERGDREEYAALVAGYGVAGTGPGLPPEKIPSKQAYGSAPKPNPAKPLRAKGKASEGNEMAAVRQAFANGAMGDDARMDAIASIVADPKAGDADRLKGWLESLKLPELKAAADKHGVKLMGRTKAEKIDSFVASTVQNKLNSQAIRGGVLDAPAPGSLAAKQAKAKAQLPDTIATAPTHLDTPRRTSGDGQFHGNHYHGDGQIGAVIEDLSPDQARINVGGKRLDDALADVIISGHSGELGATNRQIAEWQTISDQVRPIDADAASRIDRALARLKMPTVPYLSDQALADAPEPLRVLRGRIGSIPETGQGGGELKRLTEIMEGWSKGEIRMLELDRKVQSLTDLRHESQEGRFEIAKAVEQAIRDLEAMRSELRQKQNEIRARGA